MLFHYRQRNISNIIPNIAIGSEPIETVADFNFLGLTIDENLDWNPHLQKYQTKSPELSVFCVDWKTICLFTFSDSYITLWFYHIYNMEFLHGVSKKAE